MSFGSCLGLKYDYKYHISHILQKVFKGKIGNPKIKETVALAIGAVLNKFCRIKEGNCKRKVCLNSENITLKVA